MVLGRFKELEEALKRVAVEVEKRCKRWMGERDYYMELRRDVFLRVLCRYGRPEGVLDKGALGKLWKIPPSTVVGGVLVLYARSLPPYDEKKRVIEAFYPRRRVEELVELGVLKEVNGGLDATSLVKTILYLAREHLEE